jgi:transcriptional regulator
MRRSEPCAGTSRARIHCGNLLQSYCVYFRAERLHHTQLVRRKKQNGAVVPTYNYAVVHAHGTLRIVDDRQEFLALLNNLTTHFETQRTTPWQISDAPSDYIHHLMDAIVGIEIPITRITGKWKASQNRTIQNRGNITIGLREKNHHNEIAMADLMEQALFASEEKSV